MDSALGIQPLQCGLYLGEGTWRRGCPSSSPWNQPWGHSVREFWYPGYWSRGRKEGHRLWGAQSPGRHTPWPHGLLALWREAIGRKPEEDPLNCWGSGQETTSTMDFAQFLVWLPGFSVCTCFVSFSGLFITIHDKGHLATMLNSWPEDNIKVWSRFHCYLIIVGWILPAWTRVISSYKMSHYDTEGSILPPIPKPQTCYSQVQTPQSRGLHEPGIHVTLPFIIVIISLKICSACVESLLNIWCQFP